MNSFIKPLAITASIFFVLCIFLVAYEFIMLPEAMQARSSALDLSVINDIQPAINRVFMVVGLSLILGLAALLLQILLFRNRETEKIYVGNQPTRQTTAKLTDDDEEIHDVSALDTEVVSDIQKIAASKISANEKLENALRILCNKLEASQGAVYVAIEDSARKLVELRAGYALMKGDSQLVQYEYGEGLPGQVAKEGKIVNIDTVPDGYIQVLSGLGSSSPTHLLLCPVVVSEKIKGVVELASFTKFSTGNTQVVKQAFELMGKVFEESSKQPITIVASGEDDEVLTNVR